MKTLFEVRDLNGIREMLQRELLEKYDLKVPKIARKKQSFPKDRYQVFGNALYNLPSDFIQDCGYVPRFLVEAANSVDENIESEGLFRKAGSVNRQKDLRQLLEDRGSLQSAKILSIDDVANLIKQFLRELPEPLIVTEFQELFTKCQEQEDESKQIEGMMMLCSLLPCAHLGTLKFIVSLLARVVRNSTKNKMDTSNLAMVMTPNFMVTSSGKVKNEKANVGEEKNLMVQTAVVELLIRNADRIGVIPEYLEERVELLESLPMSDDEHFDQTDGLKPRKKKRRSGSLQGIVSGIKNTISKMRTSSSSISSSRSEHSLADTASQLSVASSVADTTPVLVRKRKAINDEMAFSTKKKKAILKNLPQCTLMGTSFLPPQAGKVQKDVTEVALSPAINFCDESPVRFAATPTHEKTTPSKKRRLPSPFRKARRTSSGKVGCFSPKTPKTKKSFFRRISGSEPNSPALPDSGTLNTSGKKRNSGLFKRHKKVPSSPARLLDGHPLIKGDKKKSQLAQPSNDQVYVVDDVDLNDPYYLASRLKFDLLGSGDLASHTDDVCHSEEVHRSDLLKSRAFEAEDRITVNTVKPHKRAFSADASFGKKLRRGQPNTPTNGLPTVTPNKYRHPPIPCDLLSPNDTVSNDQDTVIASLSAASVSDCKLVDCDSDHKSSDISNSNESGDKTLTDSLNNQVEHMDLAANAGCDRGLKESTSSSSVDSAVSTSSCDSTESRVSSASVKSAVSSASIKSLGSIDSGCEVVEPVDMDTAHKIEPNFKKITETVKRQQKPRLKSRAKELLEKVESFRSKRATDQFRKKCGVSRQPSIREPKFQIMTETHKLLSHAGVVQNLAPVTDDAESVEMVVMHPGSPMKHASPARSLRAGIEQLSEENAKLLHGSVLNLQAAGKVTQNRGRFSMSEEKRELAERHASPLRFTHSNIKKRGLSPVRIPTIFAKNEKQAAHLREIARRVKEKGQKSRKENGGSEEFAVSPVIVVATDSPVRSKTKASLPISNNMAKMVCENAKKKFSVIGTSNSVVLEKKDSEDISADDCVTPRRTDSRKRCMADIKVVKPLSKLAIDTGADSSSPKLPLHDSSNTTNVASKRTLPTLPKIKQAPLSTLDITSALLKKKVSAIAPQNQLRKLQLQETPRRCRSPMKPVKRLGSPSPKKSPKHYPNSPIRPFMLHPHRSNGKSPIPTHVMEDVNVY
ncbi:rho GTPase-activating protein 11A-like [Lineus longissimus]|uniref:rho GTPase-activating protein 11A-like n=1 Tax=Lineus longissimus TaxID=88925 RepID=UPI00315CEF8D